MDNLGRAITMAGSALLFVFASSISIYLYGTLFNYLDLSTDYVAIQNRAESSFDDDSSIEREITAGEILITLMNMDQMHVSSLSIRGIEQNVVKDDVLNKTPKYIRIYNHLKNSNNAYSCSYSSHYNAGGVDIEYSIVR